MKKTGNLILAIITGILAGFIAIMLVEAIGHLIFPLPADLDPENREHLEEYIKHAPLMAILFVAIAWMAGSFLGGFVGSMVAKVNQRIISLLIGIILMIAGILNMLMIPHPIWFWFVGLAVFIPSALLGSILSQKVTR